MDLKAMDLTTVEAAAAHAKNAVVLITLGGIFLSFRVWHFARTDQVSRRHDAMLAAALMGVLALAALVFVHIYTQELTNLLKAEIASAGARAAEANERAVTLESSNLELRKQVATLKMSNLAASKEMVSLQLEVAEAKRRQAVAETELAKVRKRQEPRGIPIGRIAGLLRTAPPAKVILLYQKGDRDSALFIQGLYEALVKGRWEVLESKAVDDINERGTAQGDVMFWMRSLDNQSKSVKTLGMALTEAGFNVSGMSDSALPDDTLRLKIFTKP